MFNMVSQHMESLITVSRLFSSLSLVRPHLDHSTQSGCEDLLKKLDVKNNIDRLHAVVTDARAREKAPQEYEGKDVWKEDIHPGAAARAQIMPVLEEERERLKKQLADVSRSLCLILDPCSLTDMAKLDQSNRELQATMQANVKARDTADEDAGRLLDLLEEVRTPLKNPAAC